jgi:hypothetical protein
VVDLLARVRKELTDAGLKADPESIAWHRAGQLPFLVGSNADVGGSNAASVSTSYTTDRLTHPNVACATW